jgi:hypothetical protein
MNKVFLGGTCADSNWRDYLIRNIQVPYFNPVVEDWTPEDKIIEDNEKEFKCNVHLYVITKPQSIYSIAEVVDSVHSKKQTLLHVIPDEFDTHQLKHMMAIVDLVIKRGGIAYCDDYLSRTARVINSCFKP